MANGKQVNLAELSQIHGVSLPTISNWVKQGCPFEHKGRLGKEWIFNTAKVARWREDKAAANAIGDVASLDIDEVKLRKLAAEASLAELELEKQRGLVVPIADVTEVWAKELSVTRARILSITNSLPPALMGITDLNECKIIVTKTVREALESLSEYGSETEVSDGTSDGENSEFEAAAGHDVESVG